MSVVPRRHLITAAVVFDATRDSALKPSIGEYGTIVSFVATLAAPTVPYLANGTLSGHSSLTGPTIPQVSKRNDHFAPHNENTQTG